MLNKIPHVIHRTRLTDRVRYLVSSRRCKYVLFMASFLIALSLISFCIAAYFDTRDNITDLRNQNISVLLALRANSYVEAASSETALLRLSIDMFADAITPTQRETALRYAKSAREQAIRNINEGALDERENKVR